MASNSRRVIRIGRVVQGNPPGGQTHWIGRVQPFQNIRQ
ncbi:hypothetical protein ACPOL_1529 [Acidisarcina polymorpha]|uniref:Uncharacterized protein n=1 Tax=Acidisarcina polymorpha TaxID=2211140 RepID=A0A2Z5FWW1_9BACT|nr:hypothetical protein ACPOL_1529 [Acidisarcina polymorpha]